MKKFCLLTVLVIGFTAIATSTSAQELTTEPHRTLPRNAVVYHNEFSAGYGFASIQDLALTYTSLIATVVTMTGYEERNFRYLGNFALGYKYRFNKVVSLGATYAIGHLNSDIYTVNTRWGKQRSTYHSLAAECDFRYLTRRAITLYSTVGLGATLYARSATETGGETEKGYLAMPNIQVSLIGVKVGSYRAGGIVELGYGYKGMVNVGGYVRF
jgi:hypothetical protein